jgi:hypothetical protein
MLIRLVHLFIIRFYFLSILIFIIIMLLKPYKYLLLSCYLVDRIFINLYCYSMLIRLVHLFIIRFYLFIYFKRIYLIFTFQ